VNESETMELRWDGILPVMNFGVVVVVVPVPAEVLCTSAVPVIPSKVALAVFVPAVNDSVVSERLSLSSSSSSSSIGRFL